MTQPRICRDPNCNNQFEVGGRGDRRYCHECRSYETGGKQIRKLKPKKAKYQPEIPGLEPTRLSGSFLRSWLDALTARPADPEVHILTGHILLHSEPAGDEGEIAYKILKGFLSEQYVPQI